MKGYSIFQMYCNLGKPCFAASLNVNSTVSRGVRTSCHVQSVCILNWTQPVTLRIPAVLLSYLFIHRVKHYRRHHDYLSFTKYAAAFRHPRPCYCNVASKSQNSLPSLLSYISTFSAFDFVPSRRRCIAEFREHLLIIRFLYADGTVAANSRAARVLVFRSKAVRLIEGASAVMYNLREVHNRPKSPSEIVQLPGQWHSRCSTYNIMCQCGAQEGGIIDAGLFFLLFIATW